MQNIDLRAKCAPNNNESLGIHLTYINLYITFPEPVDASHKYWVHVFSSTTARYLAQGPLDIMYDDVLFGCPSVDTPESCKDDFLFIFCQDGKAKWYSELTLISNCADSVSSTVNAIDAPEAKAIRFFADTFSDSRLYTRIMASAAFAQTKGLLIRRICELHVIAMDKGLDKLPYIVVESNSSLDAESVVTGSVLPCLKQENLCLAQTRFDLLLGVGDQNLECIREDFCECDFVVINLEDCSLDATFCDDESAKVFEQLHALVQDNDDRRAALVFFGTHDEVRAAATLAGNNMFSNALIISDALSDKDDDFYSKLNKLIAPMEQEDASDDDTEPLSARRVPQKLSPMERLERMVGLDTVKREITDARTMAIFFKERSKLGFGQIMDNRHHMLFLGNPGTGKTTVAGLIGGMYKEIGLLSKGHTIVTNRSKLIGEYIGEADQRVQEAVAEARGGVLFIDEAYTLFNGPDAKDYGKHVLHALLPVLSEDNPDLIVILAGYEDKMETMLRFNPGLLDRFPIKLHFENYDAGQLFEIACKLLDESDFTLTQDARLQLIETMQRVVRNRDIYFGNGRWVHNFIEHGLIRAMAKRVITTNPRLANNAQYCQIEACDVENAARLFLSGVSQACIKTQSIGFTA